MTYPIIMMSRLSLSLLRKARSIQLSPNPLMGVKLLANVIKSDDSLAI